MDKRYKHVALGGTFDILHSGHKRLIRSAFEIGYKVTIGVTTDSFRRALATKPLQNQHTRKKILYMFLKESGFLKRARVIFIKNIYGPASCDKSIQALVVSKQTIRNAHAINRERVENGLLKLAVVCVPMVNAYDGKTISSTRIVLGEIDQEGRSYRQMLGKLAGRRLINSVRAKLRKPFGKIVKNNKIIRDKSNVISIGDVSALKLSKLGIRRKLSVVDFLVGRKKVYHSLLELGFKFSKPSATVRNHSGQISKSLISEVARSLNSKDLDRVVLVIGEEDLAVICATLLAPIPSTVFYGQPRKGLVMVNVDIDTKSRLCGLLKLN